MELNLLTILVDNICLWTKHFPITTSLGGWLSAGVHHVHKLSLKIRGFVEKDQPSKVYFIHMLKTGFPSANPPTTGAHFETARLLTKLWAT